MSAALQKLASFLKENNHDIIDYWITNARVRWVRVVSRRTGDLYLVDVDAYNISFQCQNDPLIKQNFYILTTEPHPQHSVASFASIMTTPMVVCFGNEIWAGGNTWFTAQNIPSSMDRIIVFPMIQLDWFYENSFVVSFEVRQMLESLEKNGRQLIQKNLVDISSVIKTPAVPNIIEKLRIKTHMHQSELQKCQALFVSICQSRADVYRRLRELEDATHPEDITVRNAVHRQYLRKRLAERIEKLDNLHGDTLANLSLHFGLRWHYLLQIVNLISSIAHHLGCIQALIHDMSACT